MAAMGRKQTMRAGLNIAGFAAAFAVLAAMPAAAQVSRPSSSAVVSAPATQAAPQRRGLRLNASGRWVADLNVTPSDRRNAEAAFGEVEAGAYYRVSPRLEVGASAGFSQQQNDPARPAPSERRGEPRFRLESIFRF